MISDAEPLTKAWADVLYPGTGGGSGSSFVVMQHGTNGNAARPTGATVVYWLGSATPVHAFPFDFWYDANVVDPGPRLGIATVFHADDATVARPSGVGVVYWIGAVKPNNALAYDFWYNADVTPPAP